MFSEFSDYMGEGGTANRSFTGISEKNTGYTWEIVQMRNPLGFCVTLEGSGNETFEYSPGVT